MMTTVQASNTPQVHMTASGESHSSLLADGSVFLFFLYINNFVLFLFCLFVFLPFHSLFVLFPGLGNRN